jgi:hypothetical protein
MLGASDGVPGHEGGSGRQHRRHLVNHGGLDRVHFGDDGALLEARRQGLDGSRRRAYRHRHDDTIGALDCGHGRRRHLVAEAERGRARPHIGSQIVGHHAAGKAARLHSTGDGGTDQPEPDDGDGIAQRFNHLPVVPLSRPTDRCLVSASSNRHGTQTMQTFSSTSIFHAPPAIY